LNVKTEHIEGHTARLTVEVPVERIEEAKRKAARKLAQRVNIPGFRKGKAPFNIIQRYFGDAALLEEALEDLGQEVYREALDASAIEPYGPGQLEDVQMNETPTLIYTVPKQPVVDLGDYRAVRGEFTEPVVDEKAVDRQLDMLLEERGTFEESDQPAALENRITVDFHSFFVTEEAVASEADEAEDDDEDDDEHEHDDEHEVDDDEHDDDDDDDDEDDEEHEHGHDHDHSVIDDPKYQQGEQFMHEHDAAVMLRSGDQEPVAPGFSAAMIGATAGETREFEVDFPATDEIREDVRGKKVKFIVHVKKVETGELPELNDEFAASVTDLFKKTEDEELEPLTVEALRGRIRETLLEEAAHEARDGFANTILEQIVQQSSVDFPDEMVNDEIDNLLKQLESNLRQQGASLDFFKQITGKTDEELREDYRVSAEQRVRTGLVFTEFATREKIRITQEDIDAKIEDLIKPFGAQAENVRSTFSQPQFLNNIVNRMLSELTNDRLVAVGRGQAPELTEDEPADAESKAPAAEAVQNVDDAAADVEEESSDTQA
jgi:trigger factor